VHEGVSHERNCDALVSITLETNVLPRHECANKVELQLAVCVCMCVCVCVISAYRE